MEEGWSPPTPSSPALDLFLVIKLEIQLIMGQFHQELLKTLQQK